MEINKDKLVNYLNARMHALNEVQDKDMTINSSVNARVNELYDLRKHIISDDFYIIHESIKEDEYKKSLTEQFKMLRQASESARRNNDYKSLSQLTETMLQVGYTLGLSMEANE